MAGEAVMCVGIARNLLIQFEDDKIDETATLANTLNTGSAISLDLDLTVKVLPGQFPFTIRSCCSFL